MPQRTSKRKRQSKSEDEPESEGSRTKETSASSEKKGGSFITQTKSLFLIRCPKRSTSSSRRCLPKMPSKKACKCSIQCFLSCVLISPRNVPLKSLLVINVQSATIPAFMTQQGLPLGSKNWKRSWVGGPFIPFSRGHSQHQSPNGRSRNSPFH